MLTRLNLKRGEGKLVQILEIGSKGRRARLPKFSTPVQPQVPEIAIDIPTLVRTQVVVESSETMSHEGEPIMKHDEKTLRKAFFDMIDMVKALYEDRNSRLQGDSSKPPNGEGSSGGGNGKEDKGKEGDGNGGKPPPSSSSSSLKASSHSSTNTTVPHIHHHSSKGVGKSPFLKLDVKFKLPMYNGEVSVEKMDNWIDQLEVYCRIQNLQEDDIKI